MTFKELKAAVKGRFMKWGKYTAEKLENVSGIFESTTTEDTGKVLTVGDDGSPEWGEAVNPLPPVTSGDNGDVLSVVNGAWAKSPAPSSLPPYTSADKGKVLTVGEGSESETVVIVPEQTVTVVEGGSYLTNADFSSVSVGTSGTMTIDVDSFPVVAQDLDGMIGFMAEDGGESYAIATDGTDVFFETSITGTHTVSLTASVPSVELKFEPPAEGGGKITSFAIPVVSTGAPGEETWSLDGVTIAEVEEAFNSGKYLYFTGKFAVEWIGVPITYTIDDSDPSWHDFKGSFFTIGIEGGGTIERIYFDLWSDGINYDLQGEEELVWPVN